MCKIGFKDELKQGRIVTKIQLKNSGLVTTWCIKFNCFIYILKFLDSTKLGKFWLLYAQGNHTHLQWYYLFMEPIPAYRWHSSKYLNGIMLE